MRILFDVGVDDAGHSARVGVTDLKKQLAKSIARSQG